MQVHKIISRSAMRFHPNGLSTGHDKVIMTYNGEEIGSSACPTMDGSRILLEKGLAKPEDRIEIYRESDNMLCLVANVGKASKLDIVESNKQGFRIVKYNPDAFAWTKGKN